jgi:hypothetical protein
MKKSRRTTTGTEASKAPPMSPPEEDKMFSQRESELIQKYLQEHGEMPEVVRMIWMTFFFNLIYYLTAAPFA